MYKYRKFTLDSNLPTASGTLCIAYHVMMPNQAIPRIYSIFFDVNAEMWNWLSFYNNKICENLTRKSTKFLRMLNTGFKYYYFVLKIEIFWYSILSPINLFLRWIIITMLLICWNIFFEKITTFIAYWMLKVGNFCKKVRFWRKIYWSSGKHVSMQLHVVLFVKLLPYHLVVTHL